MKSQFVRWSSDPLNLTPNQSSRLWTTTSTSYVYVRSQEFPPGAPLKHSEAFFQELVMTVSVRSQNVCSTTRHSAILTSFF